MQIVLVSFALLAVAAAGHHGTVSSMQQVKVKELYDSITTKEYNPNVRPYGVNGTDATFVYVQLRDVNIIHVDESKGVFTFQAYARKAWVDNRLAYNDSTVSYLPVRDCKSLWYPDLFFLNGIEVSTFPFGGHHKAATARIYSNGKVFYSFRLTQTIHCPALFKTGSKDVICPVRLGSYGHFTDEMEVFFKEGNGDGGVNAVKDVILPKFTFGGVTIKPACDEGTKLVRTEDAEGHKHSCIQADFKFTRA